MKLAAGIDTGGTYTDAVIYDVEDHRVLCAGKALTTHKNLALGIENAMAQLDAGLLASVGVVSLSTTLATNACVEEKGGRAGIGFIGADKQVVAESGKKYGLPPASDIVFAQSKVNFDGSIVQDADYAAFAEEMLRTFPDAQALCVVALNAMHNQAIQEKKARDELKKRSDIPVICGYELFSDLNCLQRGASLLLNARLIPVIARFLEAIKSTLKRYGVEAPVVIVRSDGSLMSEHFTCVRPVETLLCGPAASVIGAVQLTGEQNAVIVDMGGTTTDIALVTKGVPKRVDNGVQVGRWKTFVKGLFVDTFGLGGDSAVHYREGSVFLEEKRVIPLCILAKEYPQVRVRMQQLIDSEEKSFDFDYEFLVLMDESAQDNEDFTPQERELCAWLQDGPKMLRDVVRHFALSTFLVERQVLARLVREGIILRSGLTPTDVMHLRGDFKAHDVRAAQLGVQLMAGYLHTTPQKLCKDVYDAVCKKLYCNIVRILLQQEIPSLRTETLPAAVQSMIEMSYDDALAGDPICRIRFQTPAALVGIGAPVHIFLDRVAELLHTRAVLPPYAHVANAVGAACGNVIAYGQADVRASQLHGKPCFVVYGGEAVRYFDELEEARGYAETAAAEQARTQAELHGARGKVTVEVEFAADYAKAQDTGSMFVEAAAQARAFGKIF